MPMPMMEEPDVEAEAGGPSTGYCIRLHVLEDGTFKVGEPEPYVDDDETAAPTGQDYQTIGDALKGVLEVIRDNPVGNDDQKAFEAGYGAR